MGRSHLKCNPEVSMTDTIALEEVLDLYRANGWSAAQKPSQLMAALKESHSLVTARASGRLVGLGNAISDGHLLPRAETAASGLRIGR
jgi:hypothetical protein